MNDLSHTAMRPIAGADGEVASFCYCPAQGT